MTLTVSVSSEIESQLRDSIARQDVERLRAIWVETFLPQVEQQLHQTAPPLSDEEFEALADEIADICGDVPPLSDYAFTRESFYEGHPKL